VPLGLIIGLAMMASIVLLPKFRKTDDTLKRLPFTIAGLFLSLIIGACSLFVYHNYAPHYFVWFGLTAIATFLVAIIIKTVPQIKQSKHRAK